MTESLASKYKVPPGLRPLLEAFARETLRTQPTDLIIFGRTFFEALNATQQAHPGADVINEENLYAQFRVSLQHKLHNPTPIAAASADAAAAAAGDAAPPLPPPRSYQPLPPLHERDSLLSGREFSALNEPPPPLELRSPPTGRSVDQQQPPPPPPAAASSSQVAHPHGKPPAPPPPLPPPPPQQQQARKSTDGAAMQPDAARAASPTEKAATLIQAAYRGHIVRTHPQKFGIDNSAARRQSNTNDRMPPQNTTSKEQQELKRHSVGGYGADARAAIKIQSEIRGFLARKHVEAMKQNQADAATTIQAHIRGFLTRKKMADDGLSRGSVSSIKGT